MYSKLVQKPASYHYNYINSSINILENIGSYFVYFSNKNRTKQIQNRLNHSYLRATVTSLLNESMF